MSLPSLDLPYRDTDPFSLFVFAQSITNAGVTNFNPLIISGFGYSQSKTTLLATPQAAVALVSQVILSIIAYFVPNIRCLLWMLSCLPALAGSIMIDRVFISLPVHADWDVDLTIEINHTTHPYASLAGVYLMGFYSQWLWTNTMEHG